MVLSVLYTKTMGGFRVAENCGLIVGFSFFSEAVVGDAVGFSQGGKELRGAGGRYVRRRVVRSK